MAKDWPEGMCDESKAGLRNAEQGLLLASVSIDPILASAGHGGLIALQLVKDAYAVIAYRQVELHGS